MADDEKILGIKKSELTELVKQILAEMPSSLPANGGNADYATNAGNADKLDGKHASDFKAYQGYAPIYVGDLLDIAEMGTYSCFAEEVTNLPPDIISACYVTMTRFRDAGYKQFVCSPLNLINANNHTLFLANETYKDSNGRLIWEKMFSSGNLPYIIGNVTVESGSSTANTDHNFMPSAVFWWEDKGAVYSATSFDTTSFNMAIASSVDRTINYIIFK